jgi:hypothetical protein
MPTVMTNKCLTKSIGRLGPTRRAGKVDVWPSQEKERPSVSVLLHEPKIDHEERERLPAGYLTAALNHIFRSMPHLVRG